jgi:hypothetical protein
MGRDLGFERREELFASHSPELERLEERGAWREEEEMRHRKLFAWRFLYIAYHLLGGMKLDLPFRRLEIRGMPHEMQLMSLKSVVQSLCTL